MADEDDSNAPEQPRLDLRERVSTMEDHPEFVKAIGMITVELSNMEIRLSDVLAALLNRDTDIGAAIYFTPRAAALRVAIVDSVAEALMKPTFQLFKDVTALTRRCKRAIDKRHKLIHGHWGVESGSNTVQHSPLPLRLGSFTKPELKEVQKLTSDIRRLSAELSAIAPRIIAELWPPPT
jgi:hypothetical protein